jgi:hypothetical protein
MEAQTPISERRAYATYIKNRVSVTRVFSALLQIFPVIKILRQTLLAIGGLTPIQKAVRSGVGPLSAYKKTGGPFPDRLSRK